MLKEESLTTKKQKLTSLSVDDITELKQLTEDDSSSSSSDVEDDSELHLISQGPDAQKESRSDKLMILAESSTDLDSSVSSDSESTSE